MQVPQFKLPFQIHGYTLFEEIGKGGFSSVYKCKSSRYDDQIFAAKITIITDDNKEIIDSYKSEVKILSKLSHPNVIRLYDSFEENNYFFVILEYCQSGTLQDEVNRDFPLNYRRIHYIASQLASALKYCHDRKIVHRDLKPTNVLIDDYGRPKLADFGLSAEIRDDGLLSDFKCSLAYAPPEIFQKTAYNPMKADVWSLGVLFYYIIVGKTPWASSSLISLKNSIKIGAYEFPKDIGPTCYVASYIRKMIVVDPDQRVTMDKLEEWFKFKENEVTKLPQLNLIPLNKVMPSPTLIPTKLSFPVIKSFRNSSFHINKPRNSLIPTKIPTALLSQSNQRT